MYIHFYPHMLSVCVTKTIARIAQKHPYILTLLYTTFKKHYIRAQFPQTTMKYELLGILGVEFLLFSFLQNNFHHSFYYVLENSQKGEKPTRKPYCKQRNTHCNRIVYIILYIWYTYLHLSIHIYFLYSYLIL